MRVAIVYNEPSADADAAEADVLAQVRVVAAALDELAHETLLVPCSLDLQGLDRTLARERPDVVFNLAEALGGTDRLTTLVPLLLDARRIRYTGAGSFALVQSVDKVAVKARMRAAGLPTPDWFVPGDEQVRGWNPLLQPPPESGCFIVKARSEHASIGMDDSAVVNVADLADLTPHIERRACVHGTRFFAERFVPGREFNLALICRGVDDVEVLPPAEIDFSAFAPGKPRIVGYDAKWRDDSFEFHATPRRFEFPAADDALLERLRGLALDTWKLFGMRGYARVDFRVDEAGQPWLLEVNPNPCIAPDAGFAAALAAGGIDFTAAVARMIAAAATD